MSLVFLKSILREDSTRFLHFNESLTIGLQKVQDFTSISKMASVFRDPSAVFISQMKTHSDWEIPCTSCIGHFREWKGKRKQKFDIIYQKEKKQLLRVQEIAQTWVDPPETLPFWGGGGVLLLFFRTRCCSTLVITMLVLQSRQISSAQLSVYSASFRPGRNCVSK